MIPFVRLALCALLVLLPASPATAQQGGEGEGEGDGGCTPGCLDARTEVLCTPDGREAPLECAPDQVCANGRCGPVANAPAPPACSGGHAGADAPLLTGGLAVLFVALSRRRQKREHA